jgi:hypothetical protein
MVAPVPESLSSSCAGGAFAVSDLCFALAWSRVAPGFGGWQIAFMQISTGEMIDVVPPGAEFPVFHILPRAGHVELIQERSAEAGGGQVLVARCPALRDALLLLCPLGPEGLAAADAGQSRTFAETSLWDQSV